MFREGSVDTFFGDLGDPSQGTLWYFGDPRDDASIGPLSGALDEWTETWSQRPGLLEAETGRKGYWADRVAVCMAFHLRPRRLLLCETDGNQTYWLD